MRLKVEPNSGKRGTHPFGGVSRTPLSATVALPAEAVCMGKPPVSVPSLVVCDIAPPGRQGPSLEGVMAGWLCAALVLKIFFTLLLLCKRSSPGKGGIPAQGNGAADSVPANAPTLHPAFE